MPDKTFTNEVLRAALEGLEAQKQRLDARIAELRADLAGRAAIPAKKPEIGKSKRSPAPAKPKRIGKKSAAARKRIMPKADGTSGTGPRKAVGQSHENW
jgi:hypothetical protein